MKDDATSLDRLHDLVMPPPEPWWPLTPGWMIVLAVLLLVLLAVLLRAFFRWQADRYRREAIQLLDDPSFPDSSLPELVKRVAVTAWPREEVAKLTDRPLLEFLNHTAASEFSREGGDSLEAAAFNPGSVPDPGDLREAVRKWVLHHHREPDLLL